jgi:hypothetical protein
VIDAVGMEAASGHGALHALDRVRQATRWASDRGHAFRDAIMACRPAAPDRPDGRGDDHCDIAAVRAANSESPDAKIFAGDRAVRRAVA